MSCSQTDSCEKLTLDAKTAADLMTPNVVTIPQTATLSEAVAVLTKHRISAVPVCNEFGNPTGVLSRSDLVVHDGEQFEYLQPDLEKYKKDGFILRLRDGLARALHIEKNVTRRVSEFMTPVIFSVSQDAEASTVVDALLSLGVHRLFVTNNDGEIVGVISTTDVIRHLHGSQTKETMSVGSDEGLSL